MCHFYSAKQVFHANLSVFPMTKICFSTNQVCCSYAVVAATATVGVDVVVAVVVVRLI